MRLSVPKVTIRSSQVPGCMAAHNPSMIEIGMEISATQPAIIMVLPKRPPIKLAMVAPPALEIPRSPLNISASQEKYRTYPG